MPTIKKEFSWHFKAYCTFEENVRLTFFKCHTVMIKKGASPLSDPDPQH
jgi:hypothetical protein